MRSRDDVLGVLQLDGKHYLQQDELQEVFFKSGGIPSLLSNFGKEIEHDSNTCKVLEYERTSLSTLSLSLVSAVRGSFTSCTPSIFQGIIAFEYQFGVVFVGFQSCCVFLQCCLLDNSDDSCLSALSSIWKTQNP
jgi:hypothetical protein